ncbi:MAG: hypothetical protein IKB95_00515 [Bacteroidales bacterium]|nr:hypothetical protein [Bacteroidales bacterium]
MATLELRAELFQSINPLLDNEYLLRKVIDFANSLTLKLHKTKNADNTDNCHDTDEEIEENIRQAFNELKAVKEGKSQTRDFFEVVNEL